MSIVLRTGKASEAGMSQTQLDRIDDMAKRWVLENFTPAMTYFVARKGIIVSHGTAGTYGPEKNSTPLKKDALFQLSSITKLFTATAIMMLTEEGRLSPVTRVCEIIPEFRGESYGGNKSDILINHLLTHTSGMMDDNLRKYMKEMEDKIEIPTCEENQSEDIHKWLYLGYSAPLTYKIGAYMTYSSYGYELLGEVVRRVSGMPLDRFFRERIFEPLGMKDSYLIVPEMIWDRVVQAREDSITHHMTSPENLKSSSAAGGAYSTAEDLAIFGQMFLNGGTYGGNRILSKLTVKAMTRNHTENVPTDWGSIRFPQSGWGLGFMISLNKKDDTGTLRSPQTFSHTGHGCTYLAVDPVNEVVITCCQISGKALYSGSQRRFDILSDVVLAAVE